MEYYVETYYQQEVASFLKVQEKLKGCRSSKLNFSSSSFIADDSHVKIVWLDRVIFSKHDILHFWDNVYLFKYYLVRVHQNYFHSFNNSNQACIQILTFLCALDK